MCDFWIGWVGDMGGLYDLFDFCYVWQIVIELGCEVLCWENFVYQQGFGQCIGDVFVVVGFVVGGVVGVFVVVVLCVG